MKISLCARIWAVMSWGMNTVRAEKKENQDCQGNVRTTRKSRTAMKNNVNISAVWQNKGS